MVVAGDDLSAEVCARALAAAGVGRLRLVRRTGAPPEVVTRALGASNPEVRVETAPWPAGVPAKAGEAWLAALDGAAVVVRVGLDDDTMVRAAVRLGIPAVILRGDRDGAVVLSLRRQGPCPHQRFDVPEQQASPGAVDGPLSVLAAHVAAAEALVIISGATVGEARARHMRLRLDGDATGADAGPCQTTDIPWRPECSACGGTTDAGTVSS